MKERYLLEDGGDNNFSLITDYDGNDEQAFDVNVKSGEILTEMCIRDRYEGKKSLLASDVTKQMVDKVLPVDFLEQSILSDTKFMKVDRNGFHYQAVLALSLIHISGRLCWTDVIYMIKKRWKNSDLFITVLVNKKIRVSLYKN